VGKEIEYFHQLGRTKQIHFFIVDGQPNSGNPVTECFNPIVKILGLPEILGANIHEKIYRWPWMNKERAFVQLISKLLGVEFDAIWQRHQRLLVQKLILWSIGVIAVLATLTGVWMGSQPVDVEVRLNETSVHNEHLPALRDAVVTLVLDNETKTDTVHGLDVATVFRNIPHRFLNKEVRVQVDCRNFLSVDTTLLLSRQTAIGISRNPDIYGKLRYQLWNPDTEQTAAHAEVVIDGHRVVSDAEGFVSLVIPLAEQKTVYPITSPSLVLEDSMVGGLCGPNDVIIFKEK
jgi:hypothetical protein